MESLKLSKSEVKECLRISKSEFIEQINLDCSGCISALKDYITFNRKDKYININSEISLNDDLINSQKISKILAKLQSYGEQTQSIISSIFKKSAPLNNKKRCQLHSLKQIPEINIQEHVHYICNEIVEENENCIIQEKEFDYHLQNYLKTKKFCPSCKENIQAAFKHFKLQIPQPDCACSIICFIKYDHLKNEIIIPYDAILLNALLNKAQIQPFYQHASTKEDAQEELLICVGLLIKDKLTYLFREHQSKQFIKYTFYQQIGDIFSKRLENCNKLKEGYQSKLEELEQYLMKEDEQKDKQRKKRQLKRKKRKEQQLSSDGSVRTNYLQESSRLSISPSNSEKNLLKSFGWQGSPSVSPQTRKELEILQKEHLKEINNRRKQLREQTKQCWCEWCHHHKQKSQ
ncbi:unnamed protein product [Paramecium sonneborni]|uniref:Uncharacterized protein n=1 Tax=Paramecium sonneborni TaxID=65129 RepID=A0A8S1NRZ9_9CILI|nr:unnamed protein product [Paramecium sonneborni]